MEELLFDKVKIKLNDNESYTVKLPVWSGGFLEAVDLSEVDFSDVSWCLLCCDNYDTYFIDLIKSQNLASQYAELFRKKHDSFANSVSGSYYKYPISFYDTNAQIDLSQSFEAKRLNRIKLCSCDFHGLNFIDDFNASVADEQIRLIQIRDSDVSETNLPVNYNASLHAFNSVLDSIDLSNFSIDAAGYFMCPGYGHDSLPKCSLRDTGISITLDPYEIKSSERVKALLKDVMENDKWAGCYVNDRGKPLKTRNECEKNKIRLLEQYNEMVKESLKAYDDSIC